MSDSIKDCEIFAEIAATCPAMHSRALSRTIAKRFDNVLGRYGINSSQFAVLVAIGVLGKCRANHLAGTLSLSAAAVTRSLDILERNGWVLSMVRTGRARDVTLTTAGKALVKAAYPNWRCLRDTVRAEIGTLPTLPIPNADDPNPTT